MPAKILIFLFLSVQSLLLTGFLLIGLVLAGCSSPRVEEPLSPKESRYLERGKSLVQGLAACGFCHGEHAVPGSQLVGGRKQYDIYGEVEAGNLTPSRSGLGEWSTAEIVKAIRSGIGRDDERLSQEVHRGYQWMSDEDLLSIIAYLNTLAPIEHQTDRRSIGFIERNTTGFFEKAPRIKGYVPEISARHQQAYGEYLVDHVARCNSCHNSPSSLFLGSDYLGGGQTIQNERGEKLVPGITASDSQGIGSWGEPDIVKYLKTGRTPDNRKVDSQFCPVGFYANASDQDLAAVARYLKTVPGSQ